MYQMTDIDNGLQQPPTTCQFQETDVWWRSVNLPVNGRGRTDCRRPAAWDSTICTSHDVLMDFAEIDIGPWDWEGRRKTSCHELGHVVGLQHGTTGGANSCMISGEIPNTHVRYRQYSAHHINSHINVRY